MGQDILLKCSHWQVISGKEIQLWRDCWLPSLPDGHLIFSGEMQVSCNTSVDSLINPATRASTLEFIRSFISVDAILETLIGDSMMRDMMVWPLDPKGVYFVKFGYHWKRSQVTYMLPHTSFLVVSIAELLWK